VSLAFIHHYSTAYLFYLYARIILAARSAHRRFIKGMLI
jgi:hypothetical protein